MKQWFFAIAIALMAAANNWSFLETGDPNVRMEQLLNQSEDIGQLKDGWSKNWMNDPPSHLTPIRVHGGIGP
jgi:hypothetical protein